MKQLNGMLEKILDIQHPERLNEKKANIPVTPAMTIEKENSYASFSLLDTSHPKPAGGFYGWHDKGSR